MPIRGGWRPGEWLCVCQRCGLTGYSSEMRREWTGLLVHAVGCHEERHPQEYVRGKADDMVPPFVSPPADPIFINVPQASVTLSETVIVEGGTVMARVSLSLGGGVRFGPASVDYVIAGDGDVRITSPLSGTVSIPGGASWAEFPITTADNLDDEPNASVVVSLLNPVRCTIGGGSASFIILDDDDVAALPVANLSMAPASVVEGGSFTATVTLTGGVGPASVSYAITGATDDITSPLAGSILVGAGLPSGSITITTDDDATVEAPAAFFVTISAPTDCTLGVAVTASGTINDNDTPPPTSGLLWGGEAITWGGDPMTWS